MDLDGPDGLAEILHSQLQQQNSAESASAEQDDEQNFDFLLNPDVQEQDVQKDSDQSFDFLLQDNSEDEQAMCIIRNRIKEKCKGPETRGRKPGSAAFKAAIARFAAPIDDGSDPACEPGSIEYARLCLQQKKGKRCIESGCIFG